MTKELIAGIDAGGTTFKLGVSDRDGRLLGKARVPTTTPEKTVGDASKKLQELAAAAGGRIGRLGVATFGPVDVDESSPNYGTILATPKPDWSGTPLLRNLSEALGVPGRLDTDVNGALEAEMQLGAGRGLSRVAYITVGTGIGVGIKSEGQFAGRPLHPELGHIRVARHPEDQHYEGRCAFHRDCLEGLSAAPALSDRFGDLESLDTEHPVWDMAGHYLAQLCLTLALGSRLERIILGGGVLGAPMLISSVQHHFARLDGGYLPEAGRLQELLLKAQLGDDAGLLGSFLIAQEVDAKARS